MKKKNKPDRFLMIKTSALGDILHAFVSLSYLKKRCPTAKVDWVVEAPFKELVESNPLVDRVICIDTKRWRKKPFSLSTLREFRAFKKELQSTRYQALFDVQGNTKSAFITAIARAGKKIGFGPKDVAEWPNLLFTTDKYKCINGNGIRLDYLGLLKQYFRDNAEFSDHTLTLNTSLQDKKLIQQIIMHPKVVHRKKILVCPGSNWPNKQLSTATWIEFLGLLTEKYHLSLIFLWGTLEEREQVTKIEEKFADQSTILQKLSLPTVQNLMKEMDLVLAVDSLPLHLAATVNIPTFSVFGPSNKEKYAPAGKNHISIQGACPYGIKFDKRCPKLRSCSTGACIKNVTAMQMFEVFEKCSVFSTRKGDASSKERV